MDMSQQHPLYRALHPVHERFGYRKTAKVLILICDPKIWLERFFWAARLGLSSVTLPLTDSDSSYSIDRTLQKLKDVSRPTSSEVTGVSQTNSRS